MEEQLKLAIAALRHIALEGCQCDADDMFTECACDAAQVALQTLARMGVGLRD